MVSKAVARTAITPLYSLRAARYKFDANSYRSSRENHQSWLAGWIRCFRCEGCNVSNDGSLSDGVPKKKN